MPDERLIRAEQERRLRFLNAVYDREQAGEPYSRADQVAKGIGMESNDWDPIGRVTEALADDDLIKGKGVDQLRGLVLVGLTSRGRRLVESKLVGQEPPGGSPASIGNISISGSGQTVFNIQQHSPGATQHATQHVEISSHDKRRILAWADQVERQAPSHGLQSEDLDEVREEIGALRVELAKDEPDPSKVRRIGRYVVRILASVPGSLASAGMVEAGQQIFSQLG